MIIPVMFFDGSLRVNDEITSAKDMIEYLWQSQQKKIPARFRSGKCPKVLIRVELTKGEQIALYEVCRVQAMLQPNKDTFIDYWRNLGYSIDGDNFALWVLPEEHHRLLNVKVSGVLQRKICSPAIFAPEGIWGRAMLLQAQCAADLSEDESSSTDQ